MLRKFFPITGLALSLMFCFGCADGSDNQVSNENLNNQASNQTLNFTLVDSGQVRSVHFFLRRVSTR
jgi:hypothetical protein